MLLFLPVVVLVLTLAALGASNLQRRFRSSWLLALAGASLAWVSLLFLRLQLPLKLSFPAWWAGEGLEYSATFVLDSLSWPLAFAVSSLLVASLLGQVREAVTASWVTWAPGLTITSAGLLAALSGDLLTFLFTWTLVDVLATALQLSRLPRPEERQLVLRRITILLLGSSFLLAAWMFSFYGQEFTAILIFISGSLRLGLWGPLPSRKESASLESDWPPIMLLVPWAASLALLVRADPIAEPARSALMLLAFLPAFYAAITWLLTTDKDPSFQWELGQASLVAAAVLAGQGQAALAFSLLLLLGRGLLPLVQYSQRFRFLLAGFGIVLLSGLPFTAGYWGTAIYANWASPLVFAFLPIQAALLAGWFARALRDPAAPLPPEPWMRTIQWLGYATLPIALFFFGLGLLPSLAPEDPALAWWPAAATLAAAAFFYLVFRSGKSQLHPRAQFAFDLVFSLRWIHLLMASLMRGLSWSLNFLSSLFEGPAGVLWALLFIAFLLSLASQYGLGS